MLLFLGSFLIVELHGGMEMEFLLLHHLSGVSPVKSNIEKSWNLSYVS